MVAKSFSTYVFLTIVIVLQPIYYSTICITARIVHIRLHHNILKFSTTCWCHFYTDNHVAISDVI